MRSVKMIVHVSRTLGRVVRDYARLQDASVSEAIRGLVVEALEARRMMPSDRVVTCCGARACQHVQLSHCQCYYSGDACCWCRTDPSKGVSVGTVAPAAHAGGGVGRRGV